MAWHKTICCLDHEYMLSRHGEELGYETRIHVCFPTTWKRSNIVPIPKCGDKGDPTNYRPISLLPVLSKLLERHIVNLLLQHLMETQPSFASQWGFQCGKSTVTALLETTHNWFEMLENGNDVGAMFFDFRKAFDSIPHHALLGKLENLQLIIYS